MTCVASPIVRSIAYLPPLFLALSCLTVPLEAQSARFVTDLEGAGNPNWLDAWSPVVPLAELPRTMPGAEIELPHLLILPSPRLGLFWTGGNPAGLPSEVDSSWTSFDLSLADRAGAFRRPLDPGSRDQWSVGAQSWGRLSSLGAAIGRVRFDRSRFSGGTFANALAPYATEPNVVLDTLGEETGRTSVLIEGAGGWRVGPAAVGFSVGYLQQETRTTESAVPRFVRSTLPGLSGGISVGGRRIRVGLHGRWQQSTEAVSLASVAAGSRVYELRGYDEPVAINLVATLYSRRFERDAWAWGAAAAGQILGVEWTTFAQRERRESENFSTLATSPPVYRWSARGWRAGATVQTDMSAPLAGRIDFRYQRLDGESEFPTLVGVPFSALEIAIGGDAQIRVRLAHRWIAALQTGVTWTKRVRRDDLVGARTVIRAWRPRAVGEIARMVGPIGIALGGGISEHNPWGSVPHPASMGPVYRNWINPAVALEASEAHSWLGFGALRWRSGAHTTVWLHARYERAHSPRLLLTSIPGRPFGQRNGWTLAAGVAMADKSQ